MEYPPFIRDLPSLDLPFSDDVVTTSVTRTDSALVVFFTFHQDVDLPEHSHGAQWGTLVDGEIALTVAGATRICRPGDSWDIPAGTPHAAKIKAGTRAIDVFEEPDRYPLRP
ncbi:MAG: cupin domain-containing protein [Pseudomonadota bacterium]